MQKAFRALVSAAVLVALLFPAGSKAAKGVLLGVGLGAGVPYVDKEIGGDFKTGFDGYVDVGYGFNKYLQAGIYLGSSEGEQRSYDYNVPWVQPYFGLYGRFTYPVGDSFEPYVDVGLGGYMFSASGDNLYMYSENPTLGFKFGGGLNWYFGKDKRWFIGPEVAYQLVPYNERFKVVFTDALKDQLRAAGYPTDISVDINGQANILELMVKFGYQWKK
jgi:hypothetical protein